ncbi:MAG TPA: hypothetical protein VGD49_10425 [Longimicrobiales bacterium]
MKRKKSEQLDDGIGEQPRKSPLRADEQAAPEPERPVNTEQEEGQRNRRHPSQAEGER